MRLSCIQKSLSIIEIVYKIILLSWQSNKTRKLIILTMKYSHSIWLYYQPNMYQFKGWRQFSTKKLFRAVWQAVIRKIRIPARLLNTYYFVEKFKFLSSKKKLCSYLSFLFNLGWKERKFSVRAWVSRYQTPIETWTFSPKFWWFNFSRKVEK